MSKQIISSTRSGKLINLLDIHPNQILLSDICYGLSREVRFCGQTIRPYTVCEHTILGCKVLEGLKASTATILVWLCHDMSESYIKDIPSPLKKYLGNIYTDLEDYITNSIYNKFNIPVKDADLDLVKSVDRAMIYFESRALQPNIPLRYMPDIVNHPNFIAPNIPSHITSEQELYNGLENLMKEYIKIHESSCDQKRELSII